MKKKGQVEVVMKEFSEGRLRMPSGKKVTDPSQAKAIAMSEERAAKEKGRETRTFKGRTRMRPKLGK